ncbi:zinc finger, C2H2 type [Oesophagostomum dentatum]|uniref:Zinc finger, C2H2 type n=1 Tax=Oesophagostomum dentatum TaxID=61180 RepID=A0A0B1T7T6_OESDE|nr:zinc finger, C2H2 type [Oesophagostomum dentatum]
MRTFLGDSRKNPFSSRLLDESGSSSASYGEHSCPECNEGPMPLKQLRDHVSEKHPVKIKKEEPVETKEQKSQPKRAKAENLYHVCDHCEFTCFTRSILESHLQVHHPDAVSESDVSLPSLSSISCPKCHMRFRTPYLFAVHCVGVHTTAMTDFSLMQISFNSWTQLEPWRTSMERDTNTVLVKSGMQAWGTKLFHSYHCKFDQTVATLSQEEKENKRNINCPAFVEVIEHEDGMLDCVACFGHLGHEIDGLPPEVIEVGES